MRVPLHHTRWAEEMFPLVVTRLYALGLQDVPWAPPSLRAGRPLGNGRAVGYGCWSSGCSCGICCCCWAIGLAAGASPSLIETSFLTPCDQTSTLIVSP